MPTKTYHNMLFHAFAIAIALSQTACHKDSTPASTTADLKSKLIAIAREDHLPTLSVFISSDSDPIRFDYKDKDSRIQPVTQYGIASATKLISSLIVLQYVEQKKIDLDASINQYIDISSLAGISWAASITVRNLLGHTSGIPDYAHNPSWITGVMAAHPPQSLDDKLHLIPPPDTSFRLGKFYYSNTNYVILQKIIETVSGRQSSDVFNDFCNRYGLTNCSGQYYNNAFFISLVGQLMDN